MKKSKNEEPMIDMYYFFLQLFISRVVEGRYIERRKVLKTERKIIHTLMDNLNISFEEAINLLGIDSRKKELILNESDEMGELNKLKTKDFIREMKDIPIFDLAFELGYKMGEEDHEKKVCRMFEIMTKENLDSYDAWNKADEEFDRGF